MLQCAVVVLFKAVGNAPIMRQNIYQITASNQFQAVIQFLRKTLAWKAYDPLMSLFLELMAVL
jgi:ubiquitin-like protein ATG12